VLLKALPPIALSTTTAIPSLELLARRRRSTFTPNQLLQLSSNDGFFEDRERRVES